MACSSRNRSAQPTEFGDHLPGLVGRQGQRPVAEGEGVRPVRVLGRQSFQPVGEPHQPFGVHASDGAQVLGTRGQRRLVRAQGPREGQIEARRAVRRLPPPFSPVAPILDLGDEPVRLEPAQVVAERPTGLPQLLGQLRRRRRSVSAQPVQRSHPQGVRQAAQVGRIDVDVGTSGRSFRGGHSEEPKPQRNVCKELSADISLRLSGAQSGSGPLRGRRRSAASRAAVASSRVSVRSSARSRSSNASDTSPAPSRCVVAVDVEQAHRLEQRADAVAQRGQHVGRRHVGRRRPARRRAAPAGTPRWPAPAPAPAARTRRGRAPSRRCARAARRAAITRGCSSPAWPMTAPSSDQLGAAARVPRRGVARADRQLGARGPGDGARRLDRVGPVRRRAAVAQPAARLDVAGRTPPRRAAAGRASPRRARRSRASLGRRVDRAGPGAGARAGILDEDQARLDERQVALSAAEVAQRDLEQARQQRRAQLRLGVRERVDQPQRGAARIVGGQTQRVQCAARARNGDAQHLDEPRRGERTRHGAAQRLLRRQPGAGVRTRQHRRDRLVADEPDDLLDEVGRLQQVRPPGRRAAPGAASLPVDRAARPPRAWRRPWSRAIGMPASTSRRGRRAARSAAAARACRPRCSRRPARAPPYSTSRSTQRCSATPAISRVDVAFEAPRRLAGQLVPAGGARDRAGLPVRGLEHDSRRSRRRSRWTRRPSRRRARSGRSRR